MDEVKGRKAKAAERKAMRLAREVYRDWEFGQGRYFIKCRNC